MDDLIESYKKTLRKLNVRYRINGKRIERFESYLKSKDRAVIERATSKIAKLKLNRSIIYQFIGNVEWALEWMETARRPGNKRGIERRSYQQREIVKDPRWIQAVVRAKDQGEKRLTDKDLQMLDDLLACLNKEQYECFVLIRGNGYSYSQTANLLGITSSSVEYHLREAESRLRRRVAGGEAFELQGSLF